jgi:CBS domain-containing protein
MQVSHILGDKVAHVVSVTQKDTLGDVAQTFRDNTVGFAIVQNNGDEIVGTISERDIIRHLADKGAKAVSAAVEKAMTASFVSCQPNDTLQKVMSIMTLQRTRHLVVMDNKEIQGIISIGDVVKSRLDESILDEESLRDYIAGTGYT